MSAGLSALCCGVAAAALLPATIARADQAAADDKGAQLEQIVVTATRVETNLQKTPIAVTALSAQTLQNNGVSTLLDVTNYVPSLSIGSRSGTGSANGAVAIRGMGIDATASSAAVGIYVDDVYFPSGPGNLLGMFDVNRIEVLRGPQGTLFGRNTIAGAIQYVTNPPEHSFGGYVDFTGGNFGRADVQAALNIPLGDTFALRISGASTQRDGFVHDDFNNVNRGADRTDELRLRALWTPSDRLTVDLKTEYIHERTNGRAVLVSGVNPNAEFVGLAELFGETRPLNSSYISPNHYEFSGFGAPDYFHFEYEEVQGAITYKLTDSISVKSITAYSLSQDRLAQDFSNSPLSILSLVAAHDNIGVLTEELRLTGASFSDRLHWTVGGYYYDSQERQNPGEGIVLGFAPTSFPYGNPATDITSRAVYGQATYDLTEKLSLTAGLRYSNETNAGWLIGQTLPVSATFANTAPHLGANLQVTPDVMLYVKASEGFRAGGITANAALPGGGLPYSPETAWTYEAGARMEFLDHRLRLNPTVFLTDWKDIQFNSLIPTATTVVAATQNAGDARIKGFELESQFAVTDRLTLTGSMSLLDGHYTRVGNLTYATYPFGFLATFPNPATGMVLPGSTVILPNITLNQPLQRAPKVKFAIGGNYTQPLAGDAKLVASLDYAWTDSQNSAVTISDAIQMPSYGLLNARLEYVARGGRWSIAAFGTNLTNQFYLIGGVDFAKGYTAGTTELDPGRPREYGVELRAKF
ncbi:MAG TPA: TonB-dependent receptor [Caulobacteraceae bacterium]|nr:TonB-dependent receptor [Caulobacteraceae bacterium]